VRRREFITGIGSAAAWPLAARAQQGDRVRRVGVLTAGDENDPVRKTSISAFTQALAGLGWTDGRNIRMDLRWYGNDIDRARALAQELVSLQPDIIVTSGSPGTIAVQRETRTIPIVFANARLPTPRRRRSGPNGTSPTQSRPSIAQWWSQSPGCCRAAHAAPADFDETRDEIYDAVVVDLNHCPATTRRNLREFPYLVLDRLGVGAYPSINCCSFDLLGHARSP
jgi:hypothetical protein